MDGVELMDETVLLAERVFCVKPMEAIEYVVEKALLSSAGAEGFTAGLYEVREALSITHDLMRVRLERRREEKARLMQEEEERRRREAECRERREENRRRNMEAAADMRRRLESACDQREASAISRALAEAGVCTLEHAKSMGVDGLLHIHRIGTARALIVMKAAADA